MGKRFLGIFHDDEDPDDIAAAIVHAIDRLDGATTTDPRTNDGREDDTTTDGNRTRETTMADQWIGADEVAAVADTTAKQIYLAVEAGQLPAYRIGRHLRFRRAEVDAWIRGEDSPPPPAHLTDDFRQQAVARYAVGDHPEDIALALGLPQRFAAEIERWATQAGHPKRPRRSR